MLNKTAALVSLGCAKNLVDSESMVSQLIELGYEMTQEVSEAALILVNTCGFLETAVQESIDTILRLAGHKAAGSCRKLIVAGCMVQRYGKKLMRLIPEVDLFLGTSHYHALKVIIRDHEAGSPERLWIGFPDHLNNGTGRHLTDGCGSAYLKIAEGCGNRCTFCLIPHLRGPYRSRQAGDIVEEAHRLVDRGVKELNIVAQDTTAFGSDRNDRYALVRLLESLDQIEGLEWVRLLYAYPDRISAELLQTMSRSAKIVPYLDIPLQHCVPRILGDMGRPGTDPEGIIDTIRSSVPGVALRTSLIVGFPGEREEDFQELVAFVERIRFEHLGVFAFSAEAGTRAARMPGRVSPDISEERRRILLGLQREISRRRLEALVDQVLPVLVEGFHPETDLLLTGRLAVQAPEVDGSVLITDGIGRVGEIMRCRVTAAHDYDVEAELLPPEIPEANPVRAKRDRHATSKTL